MKMKQQKGKNEIIKRPWYKLVKSTKYSIEGLVYAYSNEQSLYRHGFATILVIIIGLFLDLTFMNWVVMMLASAILLSIELLNTAVEAVVDLVTDEFHPNAKIAKDCGSAASFVASVAFGAICGFIFIEKIVEMLR